mmetsp:Transcript_4944/g.13072  ORF Transcript_4944/g.13072 Transcript_4944/m.13072 type:complete len:95 (-) Transcript_4944:162-446(-)
MSFLETAVQTRGLASTNIFRSTAGTMGDHRRRALVLFSGCPVACDVNGHWENMPSLAPVNAAAAATAISPIAAAPSAVVRVHKQPWRVVSVLLC